MKSGHYIKFILLLSTFASDAGNKLLNTEKLPCVDNSSASDVCLIDELL